MNPIPFNPATLTLSQIKDAADALRTIFEVSLREGATPQDVAFAVDRQRDYLCRNFGVEEAKPETTTVMFGSVSKATRARRYLRSRSILSSVAGRELTIHVPSKMTAERVREVALEAVGDATC